MVTAVAAVLIAIEVTMNENTKTRKLWLNFCTMSSLIVSSNSTTNMTTHHVRQQEREQYFKQR
jgi:hypothetical protein